MVYMIMKKLQFTSVPFIGLMWFSRLGLVISLLSRNGSTTSSSNKMEILFWKSGWDSKKNPSIVGVNRNAAMYDAVNPMRLYSCSPPRKFVKGTTATAGGVAASMMYPILLGCGSLRRYASAIVVLPSIK